MREIISQLYKQEENFSDYMEFLYSLSLQNESSNNGIIRKFSNRGEAGNLRKKYCTYTHSHEEKKYLLDRIKNNTPFKNKFIESLFYRELGFNYEFFKEYENAISCYEHALNYELNIKVVFNLSQSYFELKKYDQALEAFKRAGKIDLSNKGKRYYLSLLEITNNTQEYDEFISTYNQEILEKRLKNNSGFIKKARKAFNLIVQKEKSRLEQEVNQKRLLASKPQTKEQIKQEANNSFIAPVLENQKKYYTNTSSKKNKTRGLAAPIPVLEIPVVAMIVPVVPVEDKIENNPYKIFCRLFGPYEKSPIMDKHIKLHPDELETLFKALNFPFSRSDGKGDHMKATLLSTNDKNELIEQMMIIPYRSEIGPYYIRSLRESLIKMDIYPEDLKETLQNKGLIKQQFSKN